jgi:HSP20 family protein
MLPTIFRHSVPGQAGLRSPFPGLASLHDEFDRLFHGGGSDFAHLPAVDISSNEEGATVKAELPGFKPEEIDVAVDDGVLTLTASRGDEDEKEGETWYRRERRNGRFVRRIRLPFGVEADKVEAGYRDGLLTVNLPRAVEERGRKIEVKAA